jgi:hypothetical protein
MSLFYFDRNGGKQEFLLRGKFEQKNKNKMISSKNVRRARCNTKEPSSN